MKDIHLDTFKIKAKTSMGTNLLTEAIQSGGVTFGRGFKESAVVSLTLSIS